MHHVERLVFDDCEPNTTTPSLAISPWATASCSRHFHDIVHTRAWHQRLCIVKLGLHTAGSHKSPGEVDQYISSGQYVVEHALVCV